MRIVVKDLIPGREYNLQFRSKSADDVSEWSNTYRVLISTETSVPEAPTNVQLESVGDSFRATWNSVTMSTDGSPATDLAGYVVKFRNVSSGQTAQFETTDTNFELTYNLNFAAFTPIAGKIGVQVAARNNMKKLSAWSEEVIAQNPPPAPVKNLVVSSQIDAVSATWDAPDNLEDDFKEYRAYVGTSSGFVPSPSNMFWNGVGTTAVYYISTNVDWYIKVVTVDKFEGMSTEVTGGPVRPRSSVTVDVDAPDTPTNLDGTISGYDLNVTWTAPANPDNDLAGYQIGYRPVGGSGWSYATASHEDTSVTISPITRFVNYEVKIQAHDFSFNYSPWSANKTVNGEVNTAPAVPTGLQVKGAITTAMVLWNANTEDDLYGYEVQFKALSAPLGSDPVYATVSRTMSFSENVSNNTTYYARVRAVDLQGLKSAWSAPVSGTIGYVNLDAVEARIDDLQNNVIPGLAPKEDTVTEIVVQYAVNSSETTAPTTGWSTATPTRTPGSFIWYRTVVTYGDGSGSTSNPALLTGNTGSQGIQGQKGADGQSLYTWLKYADTPTTGMSDSPAGKTYMGLAFNKTSSTESNNYGDYSWSLIKGEQGVPGQPGADGNPTYTWVKYADNASGGGMSDSPTGKTYIGLAFNKATATESSTASDYQWSLIQGPKGDTGSDGATGVSVTSVTPFYRTVTKGAAAPAQPSGTGDPAGWSKTEPSYTVNTELYRTERILYSNGTAAWTTVTKVSAYSAADAVRDIAVTADKRVTASVDNPSATTGYPDGAIWYKYSGNALVGAWRLVGGSWVSAPLDRTFIPAIDIGTGTFGDLDGVRIKARSIIGESLVIGTNENLIPNGSGEFGGLGGWARSHTAVFDNTDAPAGLPGSFKNDPGSGGTSNETWDVEPNTEYLFEVWLKADKPDSRMYIELRNQEGVHASTAKPVPGQAYAGGGAYPVSNHVVPTVWTKYSAIMTTTSSTFKMKMGTIYWNHQNGTERTAVQAIAGMRLKRRMSGVLIEDGAVSAQHVQANSIGANEIKTAEIAADDAFLDNLVVTTGHISDLTFDKIEGGGGIVHDLTIKAHMELGSSTTNGIIQTYGYNSGQGVRIDKTGIIVNSGSISASALNINIGRNMMPIEYADFELHPDFYTHFNGNPTSGVNWAIVNGGKYNSQSLRLTSTSAGTSYLFFGKATTDYNIGVEPGKTYIISGWFKKGSSATTRIRLRVRHNDATYSAYPELTVPSNTTWTRLSTEITIPSGITSVIPLMYIIESGVTVDVDGLQFEEKTGNSSDPSPWAPPGVTTVDGSIIRTGEIRSNTNVNVNGTQQPMWSINMDGGMQIGSAVIRGNLTVGATSDGTGSVIQSSNYVPNTSGFVLRGSNGFAEFQNVLINMIGTSSKLIAGKSLTGERTEISNIGLQYFGGDVDFPGAVSEFGYDLRIIDVTSAEGESESGGRGSVYGIDNQGELNVNTASISNDPVIGGTALMGTFMSSPDEVTIDSDLGWLSGVSWQGRSASITLPLVEWTSTTEKAVAETTTEILAGRAYLVIVSGTSYVGGATDQRVELNLRKTELLLPSTGSVPRPTTSSPTLNNETYWINGNRYSTSWTWVAGLYVPTKSALTRWLLTARFPDSGAFRMQQVRFTFLDVGERSEGMGIEVIDRRVEEGGSDTGNTTPKKTYTSRWYANSITRRQGSYTTPTGDRTGQALQGWTSGMSGNAYQTVLGFTGTAYYGEKGKSITSALSGATVDRVRIRVTHASGFKQPARLGIQASQGTQASINQTTSSLTAGQTLTTVMNSTFRTRLAAGDRYITFGPGSNTAGTYAAFHGTSGGNSKRVMLEITYTK